MDTTTSWGDWLQSVGSQVIKGYADAKVYLPFQQAQQEINQLGQAGYYNQGQRGINNPSAAGSIAGVPPVLLLLGGAVVVVLLLKA